MTVRINCPCCGAPCNVADEHLHRPIQCYKCKQVFSARIPPPGRCRLEVGGASSRGRVRDRNEDSFLVLHSSWMSQDVRHDSALLVVADGMGGYQAGDRASRLFIQTAAAQLGSLLVSAAGQPVHLSASALTSALDRCIKEANRIVHMQATTDPACKGMGATVAVVLVRESEALIAHVGDCRVYLHRGGKLAQVTKDQTLVARMVELGQLTPEMAQSHPARSEVSQAIGKRADIEPAHGRLLLAPGDWLIACCDGLYNHVDNQELQKVLNEPPSSARHLARHLIDLADLRGGSDNGTALAVNCY